MANLFRIKTLAELKKITIRDLSKKVGITEQGLQKLIRENSTKTETIERIATALEVPINVFFDSEIDISSIPVLIKENKKIEADCKNCISLQKLVDSQERLIQRLEVELEECKKIDKRKAS